MPRPIRVDAPGAVHHLIARGNEQKAVFRDDADRRAFLSRLDRCHERLGFAVYAYCLMDNHVHLAVRTGCQPLARFALTLLSAYASDFNRRHRRVGHLFQGRYKAFRVRDDRHMLAVVRYIHRNPVAAGIVAKASDYQWSSDRQYRRPSRFKPTWLDTATVRGVLSDDDAHAQRLYCQLIDGVQEEEQGLPAVVVSHEVPEAERKETASVIRLKKWTLEEFARAVSNATGEPLTRLRSASRQRSVTRARALTALLARDLAGIPLSRTAAYFRRDESTVTRAVLRLEEESWKKTDSGKSAQKLQAELLNNATIHG